MSGDALSTRMYATYFCSSADQNMTFFVSDQSRERFENIGSKVIPSGDFMTYTPASSIEVGCTAPMFHCATIFHLASGAALGFASIKTVPAAWVLSRQSRGQTILLFVLFMKVLTPRLGFDQLTPSVEVARHVNR